MKRCLDCLETIDIESEFAELDLEGLDPCNLSESEIWKTMGLYFYETEE